MLSALRSIVVQLNVGYTLFTGIELNDIYLSCRKYVKLVSVVPLTFLISTFICQAGNIATKAGNSRYFYNWWWIFLIFFLVIRSNATCCIHEQVFQHWTEKSICACLLTLKFTAPHYWSGNSACSFRRGKHSICAQGQSYPVTIRQNSWSTNRNASTVSTVEQRIDPKCSEKQHRIYLQIADPREWNGEMPARVTQLEKTPRCKPKHSVTPLL